MTLLQSLRMHKHALFANTFATVTAYVLYENGAPLETAAAVGSFLPLFSIANAYYMFPAVRTQQSIRRTTLESQTRLAYVHERAQAVAVGIAIGVAAYNGFQL